MRGRRELASIHLLTLTFPSGGGSLYLNSPFYIRKLYREGIICLAGGFLLRERDGFFGYRSEGGGGWEIEIFRQGIFFGCVRLTG